LISTGGAEQICYQLGEGWRNREKEKVDGENEIFRALQIHREKIIIPFGGLTTLGDRVEQIISQLRTEDPSSKWKKKNASRTDWFYIMKSSF